MVDTIIRLFDSVSNTFTTNGLGSLPDAASCKVTEERNGSFELEMTYPITGKRFSDLSLRKIIVAKSNPYSSPQPFRIYSITKPINGIVTVYAEHISYDLSGYPVAPFEAGSITDAFVRMKSASAVNCPFSFWTDKTTVASMKTVKPYSMRSLLGGSSGSFLDVYGGEYEFDGYSVKLWNNRGANRGVSIRYGKNLTDLKQEENCSNVYTGVYPFWYSDEEGLVTLPEKFINAPGTYDFVRIYPLDLTEKFQEHPTESQLRSQAETYIKTNNIGVPKVSLSVSFVQLAQSEEYKNVALLETVHLCDTVNVEFPELGVSGTAKCITTVYNVLTDKYDRIELGDAKSNLSTAIADQNQSVRDTFDEQKSSLQKAIENATQLITGGLGGYVIIHSSTGGKKPDEILIMDTDDILTAKEVWRWNKGGLGYSKTGYAGPFTTAITQDGQIVADFITAGEFDGAIIKAGSIMADMLSVDYRNSVKEYADSVGKDVYKECQVLIENTANAIQLLVKQVFEYSTHNYCEDPFVNDALSTSGWYTNNSSYNYTTSFLGLHCMRIYKNSTNSSYFRYNLGLLKAGTYRIRYKAACSSSGTNYARVQCTAMGTAKITSLGQLSNTEWTTFEFDVTLSSDSSYSQYIYFYAYAQSYTVYVTEVEVLGSLSVYTQAQIKINADSITEEVKRATGVEEDLKASIKINADNITSCVTKGNIGSYITQYYNNVLIAFNNSSKYVQITAGSIGIYNGTVDNDGLRSRFDSSGEHFYRDGYYVGKIGTNQWTGDNSHKGLVFDLEYLGKYMCWAQEDYEGATTYTTVLTYSRGNSIYQNKGLNLGCNFYGNNFRLDGFDLRNSIANGYTVVDYAKVPIVTEIHSTGDGGIGWTYSSFTVRNGMVVGVPQ